MHKKNKLSLFGQIETRIQSELNVLTRSVHAAAEAATHEESKPENKYDTFGLEASYLAGAQKERLAELKATLTMLRNMAIVHFSNADPIKPTALIELESDGKSMFYLLLVLGPGYVLDLGEHSVLTITTHSPLGKSLIGKTIGEIVKIKNQIGFKEYEIVNLY